MKCGIFVSLYVLLIWFYYLILIIFVFFVNVNFEFLRIVYNIIIVGYCVIFKINNNLLFYWWFWFVVRDIEFYLDILF